MTFEAAVPLIALAIAAAVVAIVSWMEGGL